MTPIKNFIAAQFVNKSFRFKCDCLIPIDTIGIVKDYEITNNEIILFVSTPNSRVIHIGLNTPSLHIEALD